MTDIVFSAIGTLVGARPVPGGGLLQTIIGLFTKKAS